MVAEFTEDCASILTASIMVLANRALSEGWYENDPNIVELLKSMNLMEITFVKFEDSSFDQSSAFYWDGHANKLCMNFSVLNKIINSIAGLGRLMGLSREEITFIAVSLFIFHEANHIVQGIPDYTGVQTIKKSGGSDLICELDIISDGIAARILAGINLLGQAVSWDAYFKQVHGALTLSFLILTKSFPFKPSKSTKVARGLSLLVMRERITDAIYQANFDKSQIYAVKASVSEKMCKIFVITLECQIRAVLSLSDISSVNIQKLGKQISLGDIEEAENLLMGNYQSKFPIASSGS